MGAKRKPKRKRGYGRGTVYWEERTQQWVGKVRLPHDDGTTTTQRVTGNAEDAVHDQLDAVLRRHQAGLETQDITVGLLLDGWLGSVQGQVRTGKLRANTYRQHEYIVRLHLRPKLGRIFLRNLRPSQVEAMLTALQTEPGPRGKPLSAQTALHAHRTLHRALGYAVRDGLAERNVAADVDAPRPSADRPPEELAEDSDDAWTDDDAQSIIDAQGVATLYVAAQGNRWAALWYTLATTGMRPGEAVALTTRDIDLDSTPGIVRVRWNWARAMAPDGSMNGYALGRTKTEESRRDIPLPPQTVAVLRRHVAALEGERTLATDWPRYKLGRVPLFVREDGQRPDIDYLTVEFRRLANRAGFPKLSMYRLRHSYRTMLAAANVPLGTAKALMGHTDIRTTANIYSHVRAGDTDVADVLERVLEPVPVLLAEGAWK